MYIEPVMMSFLRNVIDHHQIAIQNRDLLDKLNELVQCTQNERVSVQVTHRRAFRCFEIGYSMVLEQNDYRHDSWKPDPRVDIANLGAYEAILQEVIDRGTIFFVEAKLEGNTLKEGVDAIKKSKMSRAMDGAERVIDLAQGIRWLLTVEEATRMAMVEHAPGGFDLIGKSLANTCRIMAVGLSTQITIGEELMKYG